jgi:regulation of enolase protein 1 (concanavalin A-like superfamily)
MYAKYLLITLLATIWLLIFVSKHTTAISIPENASELTTVNCFHLAGTANYPRVVIVPAGFDGTNQGDLDKYEKLASDIVNGFVTTEPYASNMDRITFWRLDDFRGVDIDFSTYEVWYNPDLIDAADTCDFNQIIVITNNSGWAGGAPGIYSVIGSGTPDTCDPITCTGEDCPPANLGCSWDLSVPFTALHETGHTFAGLRHTCSSYSREAQDFFDREYNPMNSIRADDPINCGTQFSGDENLTCTDWDSPMFYDWVLEGDTNFGCYPVCDDHNEWYRSWDTNQNIMCRDDLLVNGFTPVDRRLLFEFLGGDRIGFCDPFTSSILMTGWEWIDPLEDSTYDLDASHGQITLSTPDGGHDLYLNTNAPRLLQRVGGDFTISTQVTSAPTVSGYQGAGLLIWQDENNYIRLERTSTGVAFIYRVGGDYNHVSEAAYSGTTTDLKITRNNNYFRAWYFDETDWILAGEVSYNAKHELKGGISLINEWQNNPAIAVFSKVEFNLCATPQMPSQFKISPSSFASLTLSWQDNSNNETGFHIYRSGYSESEWNFVLVKSVGANETTFIDRNLSASTNYYYVISAFNNNGESDWTSSVMGTTLDGYNTYLPIIEK